MIKLALLVILLAIIASNAQVTRPKSQINSNKQIQMSKPISTSTPEIIPTPTVEPIRSVLIEVPFVSQAPTAEWSNSIFQDGCEEASALMVWCAISNDKCQITNGKVNTDFAKEEIVKMAMWQREKYGSAVDTSAKDTGERLLRKYLGNVQFSISNVKSKGEIIQFLMNEQIVIAPTNGKLLFNPNFKNGGPERHNVVIKGYDLQTDEFISNDPGTRLGENYRYDADLFVKAIRDYPTGDHEKIIEEVKRVIVVGKII